MERRAEVILQESGLELYKAITDRVRKVLVEKGKKGEIFDVESVVVFGYGDQKDLEVKDEARPQLVVLVKPDVSEEEVRNLILGKEGRRIYRNTVVVVCPRKNADFYNLLSHAAKIKAAEEIKSSIKEYYENYPEDIREDIRKIQEKRLENYKRQIEDELDKHLLSTLTEVAYPRMESGRDVVKWTTVSEESSALIPRVEVGLKDKIKTNIEFRDLAEFLKDNQNWDLVEGKTPYKFKDIMNTFYTVTSAPLTTREAIEKALKDGVESLDIGIKMRTSEKREELYWKRIGPENGANIPPRIDDEAEILPYKVAAELLKNTLLDKSGTRREEKAIREVWYEVEFEGRSIRLEDLIHEKEWERIIKWGKILEKEREIKTGFMLSLKPSTLTVKEGGQVKIEIEVKSIDFYDQQVEIEVNEGTVTPKTGKPPFNAVWDLGVFETAGVHTFKIRAVGEDRTEVTSTLTVNVEGAEEEIEVRKLEAAHGGAKLDQIEVKDSETFLMAVERLSKISRKALVPKMEIVFGENKNIVISCKDINSSQAKLLAQKLR